MTLPHLAVEIDSSTDLALLVMGAVLYVACCALVRAPGEISLRSAALTTTMRA